MRALDFLQSWVTAVDGTLVAINLTTPALAIFLVTDSKRHVSSLFQHIKENFVKPNTSKVEVTSAESQPSQNNENPNVSLDSNQ